MNEVRNRSDRIEEIATEMLSLLGAGRQVSPLTERYPGFDLAEAYAVAEKIRELRGARGETPVGRKLGFTNRAAWSAYGISGPVWNYVYDDTVLDLAAAGRSVSIAGLPEPRIEAELMFHFYKPPSPGMSEDQIMGCVDWIAHGFEVVQSIYPGWHFTAADALAAYGVHGRLLIGERRMVKDAPHAWHEALSGFSVEITCNDGTSRRGHARDVLGSPVKALTFLLREIERFPGTHPLAAGEIVTTGTITEAMPLAVGQTWTTKLTGIGLPGLEVTVR
jgi:2-oxo-3-hexenedioate decarboxylase